jgi:hypothetical protein
MRPALLAAVLLFPTLVGCEASDFAAPPPAAPPPVAYQFVQNVTYVTVNATAPASSQPAPAVTAVPPPTPPPIIYEYPPALPPMDHRMASNPSEPGW